MKYLNDPRQSELFDLFDAILSETARRRLRGSWQHLFRRVILELMPARELATHFSPDQGRPTIELYAMAGLLLIMEFRNWTAEDASDAFMFDTSIQYALNLRPENQSLCSRSVERYQKLFREDELASQVMSDVTTRLVELLELDVSKQRLDSTHIESHMAVFGRTRLMGVAIKGFLTQLKRHDAAAYEALPSAMRERYAPSRDRLFGLWGATEQERQQQRQQVAEELWWLVEQFANHAIHRERSTYKTLVRVLHEQCEIREARLIVRTKTGGDILLNPSDPDATLDGHKGAGYQVQLSETCSAENDVQLIVAALPQTAVESDSTALQPVIEQLQKHDVLPAELLADTAYGSDDNHTYCAGRDVDLIAPTSGKSHQKGRRLGDRNLPEGQQPLTIDDFEFDETNHRFVTCPAGHETHCSHYDRYLKQHMVMMLDTKCVGCPLIERCPIRATVAYFCVYIKDKDLRLLRRRKREQTEEFRERYRKRSGIEATNSQLKTVTGLGRLRVRGERRVAMAILLKVAGWNILRAAHSKKWWECLRRWLESESSDHTGQAASRTPDRSKWFRDRCPAFQLAA